MPKLEKKIILDFIVIKIKKYCLWLLRLIKFNTLFSKLVKCILRLLKLFRTEYKFLIKRKKRDYEKYTQKKIEKKIKQHLKKQSRNPRENLAIKWQNYRNDQKLFYGRIKQLRNKKIQHGKYYI